MTAAMTLEELGRYAMTLPKWRWMDGMRVVDQRGIAGRMVNVTQHANPRHLTPDFSDPATLGCVLALVREAWGNSRLHAEWYMATMNHAFEPLPAGWTVYVPGTPPLTISSRLPTEAHALIAALEAAP